MEGIKPKSSFFSRTKIIIFLALIFLFSIFALVVFRQKSTEDKLIVHKIESLRDFELIEAKVIIDSDDDRGVLGTVDGDSRTHDENGDLLYFMCQEPECQVKYEFEKQPSLSKISIHFINYPDDESDVGFLRDDGDDSDKVFTECDKEAGICTYYYPDPKKTEDIAVVMKDANYREFGIREIKFYEAQEKSWFQCFYDLLFIWDRDFLIYLFYPVLFFALLIAPGLVFGEIVYRKKGEQTGLLSVILSSFVFYLILYFVTIKPSLFPLEPLVLIFALLLGYFLLNKGSLLRKLLSRKRKILLIYLISLLVISSWMFVRDHSSDGSIETTEYYSINQNRVDPIAHGSYKTDFLIPYQSALFFDQGGKALEEKVGIIYQLTDRTPLISYVWLFFGKTFGMNFFTFQMFIVMMASLLVFSVFELARIFLGAGKSYAVALLVVFSNFFMFTTLFGPAKTITLFFILGAAYYLTKKEANYHKAGAWMALSYLSHPFALVYYFSFLIYIALKNYLSKVTVKQIILQILAFSYLLVIIFVGWSIFSRTIGEGNNVYGAVIFGESWSEAGENIQSGEEPGLSVLATGDYWRNKGLNTLGLFIFSSKWYPEIRLFDFSKTTIPGALGVFLSVALIISLIIGVIRKFKNKTKNIPATFRIEYWLSFILLPIVIAVIYQGFYLRMGLMWYVLGVLPFILIFIASFFEKKWWWAIAFLAASENLYLFLSGDKINRERILDFFRGQEVVLIPFFVMLAIIFLVVNGRLLTKSKNENYRG